MTLKEIFQYRPPEGLAPFFCEKALGSGKGIRKTVAFFSENGI
jgi:hypothetical protein